MDTLKSLARTSFLVCLAIVSGLTFNGCEYEVPITAQPTRKIDEKLVGNWIGQEGKEKLKVRKLDDFTYIGSNDGALFRAYHSDVAKASFLSIQDMDSTDPQEQKYVYATWKLSADGHQLGLRIVNPEVIPKETKDSAAVQKLLEKNLTNTNLFEGEVSFTREK